MNVWDSQRIDFICMYVYVYIYVYVYVYVYLLKTEKSLLLTSRYKVRDKIDVPGKPLREGKFVWSPDHAMTSKPVEDSSKGY